MFAGSFDQLSFLGMGKDFLISDRPAFGSWSWQSSTNEFRLNPMFAEILGLGSIQLSLGLEEWSSRLHAEDKQAFLSALLNCMQGRTPSFSAVHRMKHSEGFWVWLHALVIAHRSDDQVIQLSGTVYDITNFKASELMSSDLQRIANIGGWELDIATNKTRWTEQTYRIHNVDPGTSTDTLMGLQFYAPHDRNRIEAHIKACLLGTPFRETFEFYDRSGAHKWVEVMGDPVRSTDGRIVRLRGTIQDITEKKRSADKLIEREAYINALFEQSRDPMMTLAPPDWCFKSANAAALELFGVSTEAEFIKLGPWMVSPERQPDGSASSAKALHYIESAMREGSHFFDWQHCRLDGQPIPCTVLLSKVAFGNNVFLQATVRDVSALKAQERELIRVHNQLYEDKTQLESLIRNSPGMTYQFRMSHDGDMSFSFVSAQVLDIYGLAPEAFLEDPKILLSHAYADDREELFRAIEESAKKMQNFRWVGRIVTTKGEIRWIRATSIPRTDGNGGIIWDGLMTDITEERLAQEKLNLERAKALHASKLASLGEMSAGIAHEINNPLAIIQSTLELLHRVRHEEEKFQAKLDLALKAVSRITRIVRGLRKFARASDNEEKKPNSLAALLREALIITEAKAKRNDARVELAIEQDNLVLCDAVEIEQVVINLINNSLDAIQKCQDRWVRVRLFMEASEVVVQFIDSGHGIKPEVEAKLFQPFFTTKPVGEGTGLGLSICKGILEQHNASLRLIRESSNTCFEIRFPHLEGKILDQEPSDAA